MDWSGDDFRILPLLALFICIFKILAFGSDFVPSFGFLFPWNEKLRIMPMPAKLVTHLQKRRSHANVETLLVPAGWTWLAALIYLTIISPGLTENLLHLPESVNSSSEECSTRVAAMTYQNKVHKSNLSFKYSFEFWTGCILYKILYVLYVVHRF